MDQFPCKYGHFDCSPTEGGPCSNETTPTPVGSWHPDRDGFGTVLAPENPDGSALIIHNGGITYEDAVARYGPLTRMPEAIPVTVWADHVPLSARRTYLDVIRDPLYRLAMATTRPVLLDMAHDMPYRREANKAELAEWLVRYAPDRISSL